jgi:hypothetical protein
MWQPPRERKNVLALLILSACALLMERRKNERYELWKCISIINYCTHPLEVANPGAYSSIQINFACLFSALHSLLNSTVYKAVICLLLISLTNMATAELLQLTITHE